jgi:hypothetical protein
MPLSCLLMLLNVATTVVELRVLGQELVSSSIELLVTILLMMLYLLHCVWSKLAGMHLFTLIMLYYT